MQFRVWGGGAGGGGGWGGGVDENFTARKLKVICYLTDNK